MSNRSYFVAALFAALTVLPVAPAFGQGEVLITQAKVLAGNVTPGDPAGFPAVINVSGSYKLASNLLPGPNLNGIVVAVPDVTIDLNGFELEGGLAGGVNNSKFGIVSYGDRLTVRNGTIGAFKIGAIYAESRDYLIVENMRFVNNYNAINNEAGDFARIQNNTIASNSHSAIVCGKSCHIEGNVISNNVAGVYIDTGTVLGNTIIGMTGGVGIVSATLVGFGNNTLIGNSGGATTGAFIPLFPNACSPVAC